jgi:hypothetical protein
MERRKDISKFKLKNLTWPLRCPQLRPVASASAILKDFVVRRQSTSNLLRNSETHSSPPVYVFQSLLLKYRTFLNTIRYWGCYGFLQKTFTVTPNVPLLSIRNLDLKKLKGKKITTMLKKYKTQLHMFSGR